MRPVRSIRASKDQVRRRNAVVRGVARFVAFYVMTATLIVVGVGVHEYSHYAAHEGMGVPEMAYHENVRDAQEGILQVEHSRAGGQDILVQQPKATTIVFFPNTFVQAAGLGLLPAEMYADEGVLASTFFHLDDAQVAGLQSRDGEMPDPVVAAPLWVAGAVFLVALAWCLVRPNLFNKALLVAYAVQIGDAGHHASALGMDPVVFYALSTIAIVVAALLVALRTRRAPKEGPDGARGSSRPDFRPATRVIVTAPAPRVASGGRLSVRRTTDNSRTRRPVNLGPATWT